MASRRRKIIELIIDRLNDIVAGSSNDNYTYNTTLRNKVIRSSGVLNKLNDDVQAFVMDGEESRDFQTHLRTHAPMQCSILLVARRTDEKTARQLLYEALPDIEVAIESTKDAWSIEQNNRAKIILWRVS